ncbi:MAG: DEAD/DEAH box helicase [Bacilli bacterium]|nr:DEAD/DEAH box helicase [Bacilli bacterium]
MTDLIYKIINGLDLDIIIKSVIKNIYKNGPIDFCDLEILSYYKHFQNDFFLNYENEIIQIMGLFYKDVEVNSLKSLIMQDYKESIFEVFGQKYTPVQADIYSNSISNKNFSFSSGTSTGKSYIFNQIIKNAKKDIVIIVPSRALINEYLIKINNYIIDKNVNILPFIDFINLKHCTRSIFVVTPERAKELFKFKNKIDLEYVLFDEAQLSDENSSRAVIFDSIVRRIDKYFPNAKKLFAQPFIENPEAQIIKNNLSNSKNISTNYKEKNVGQLYISYEKGDFFCFGLDKNIMGNRKIKLENNPVVNIINKNGTILIYTHKSKIYNGKIFEEFQEYIDMCEEIVDEKALNLISEFKNIIGGSDNKNSASFSKMLKYMKKGIILHHGSLPLQARLIIEEFTKYGFCKMCFSTSTLVQGINMPFDLVWLDFFEASKPLSIKNIIGRAGRSTMQPIFDYGIIIIKDTNKSEFRKIMTKNIYLNQESILDTQQKLSDELEEYKEAVKNDTVNDEYNLTQKEIERITKNDTQTTAKDILDLLFINENIINGDEFSSLSKDKRTLIYTKFQEIYRTFLNGRELSKGEKGVLSTAIKILIWQIQGKTFKQIVGYRYANLRQNNIIRPLLNKIKNSQNNSEIDKLKKELYSTMANFTTKCADIPNKDLHNIPLFNCKAYEIDYDLLVYDTYDYVDKIIGFKLKDIYYALFYNLYLKNNDIRAKKLSQYIKYGTIDEKEIMMLRYGYSFETIEWLKSYIYHIDETQINFYPIKDLSDKKIKEIGRYL